MGRGGWQKSSRKAGRHSAGHTGAPNRCSKTEYTRSKHDFGAFQNRAFFRAPPPIEIAPRERRSRREPEKNRHFGTLTTHFPKRNQQHINKSPGAGPAPLPHTATVVCARGACMLRAQHRTKKTASGRSLVSVRPPENVHFRWCATQRRPRTLASRPQLVSIPRSLRRPLFTHTCVDGDD